MPLDFLLSILIVTMNACWSIWALLQSTSHPHRPWSLTQCRSPPVTLSLLSWPQRRKRLVSFWQEIRLRTELWGEADKLHVWCLICINLSNFYEENITWIAIRGSCHLLSGQLQYFWHTINVRSRLPQCNAWTMVGVNVTEIYWNPLHVLFIGFIKVHVHL